MYEIKQNNVSENRDSSQQQTAIIQQSPEIIETETYTVKKFVHSAGLNVHVNKDLGSAVKFALSQDSIVDLSDSKEGKEYGTVKIKCEQGEGWVKETLLRDFKITGIAVGSCDEKFNTVIDFGKELKASKMDYLCLLLSFEVLNNFKQETKLEFRITDPSGNVDVSNATYSELKSGNYKFIIQTIKKEKFIQKPGEWRLEVYFKNPEDSGKTNYLINIKKIMIVQDGNQQKNSPKTAGSYKVASDEMVNIPGKSYAMLKTEVTQKLYESVMGSNPSNNKGDNNPVECVSWYDAVYFCNKLSEAEGKTPVYSVNGSTDVTKWDYIPHKGNSISGTVTQNTNAAGYRLPTDEEWGYAAMGGENKKYAGSDNLDEVGWYKENSGDKTHPVAMKKANGYGLYDMSGNVWEWCWDVDSLNSDKRHTRGGGKTGSTSVSSINMASPEKRFSDVGFRVVCSTSRSV